MEWLPRRLHWCLQILTLYLVLKVSQRSVITYQNIVNLNVHWVLVQKHEYYSFEEKHIFASLHDSLSFSTIYKYNTTNVLNTDMSLLWTPLSQCCYCTELSISWKQPTKSSIDWLAQFGYQNNQGVMVT